MMNWNILYSYGLCAIIVYVVVTFCIITISPTPTPIAILYDLFLFYFSSFVRSVLCHHLLAFRFIFFWFGCCCLCSLIIGNQISYASYSYIEMKKKLQIIYNEKSFELTRTTFYRWTKKWSFVSVENPIVCMTLFFVALVHLISSRCGKNEGGKTL